MPLAHDLVENSTATAKSMIALRKVTKVYSLGGGAKVTAVRDVTLDIVPGAFVVLTGRSGSGKSTLLNLAAGLTRPTSGEVQLAGVNLAALRDREQARLRNSTIGFVFQFPSLLPSLSVLENAALPAIFGDRGERAGRRERAVELLRKMGLADMLHVLPRQLSAGQQKRVVIARALLNQPAVLLADEPTGDLDEHTEREIVELLREVNVTTGQTVLMATHNRGLMEYATKTIEMSNGSLV